MSTGIELNIELGDMSKSLAKWKFLENALESAIQDGLLEFAERYEDKLREEMSSLGVPQSVVESISVAPTNNGLEISIAGELVEFFEYGTGMVGMSSPHPKVPMNWQYDVNEHGYDGWWYPTDGSDPNPYKWTDKNGTLRAWTRGKISRPFIYNTTLWGKRSITNIVRKHIRRIRID